MCRRGDDKGQRVPVGIAGTENQRDRGVFGGCHRPAGRNRRRVGAVDEEPRAGRVGVGRGSAIVVAGGVESAHVDQVRTFVEHARREPVRVRPRCKIGDGHLLPRPGVDPDLDSRHRRGIVGDAGDERDVAVGLEIRGRRDDRHGRRHEV